MVEIPGTEFNLNNTYSSDIPNSTPQFRYPVPSHRAAAATNLISVQSLDNVGPINEYTETDEVYRGIDGAEAIKAIPSGYENLMFPSRVLSSNAYENVIYGMGLNDQQSAALASGVIAGAYGQGITEDFSTASSSAVINTGAYEQYSSEMASAEEYSGGIVAGNNNMLYAPILPLSAYKIQVDPNPTIVTKMLTGREAQAHYRQNIMVRFLRPPAPPAPGPLIIKEVRLPQPRPAPPLIIRQRPPRTKTPPPLVLREKPPKMPAAVKTQVIFKRLAALPAPPRQVIIERYPPLPPKPRDVIIERWLQYGPLPKRKVIYQRAAEAKLYKTAKNVIIQYTAPQPRINRVFHRLGVVDMNPLYYLTTHGASLLDANSLVIAARTAGVFENISPPGLVYARNGLYGSSATYGAESLLATVSTGSSAFDTTSGSEVGLGEQLSSGLGTEIAGYTTFGASGAEINASAIANQFEYGTSAVSSDYSSASYGNAYETSNISKMQSAGEELQNEVSGTAISEENVYDNV